MDQPLYLVTPGQARPCEPSPQLVAGTDLNRGIATGLPVAQQRLRTPVAHVCGQPWIFGCTSRRSIGLGRLETGIRRRALRRASTFFCLTSAGGHHFLRHAASELVQSTDLPRGRARDGWAEVRRGAAVAVRCLRRCDARSGRSSGSRSNLPLRLEKEEKAASSASVRAGAASALLCSRPSRLLSRRTWFVDRTAGSLIPEGIGPAHHSVFPATPDSSSRASISRRAPPDLWCSISSPRRRPTTVFDLLRNTACGMQRFTAPPLRGGARRPPHRRSARTGPGYPGWTVHQALGRRAFVGHQQLPGECAIQRTQWPRIRAHQRARINGAPLPPPSERGARRRRSLTFSGRISCCTTRSCALSLNDQYEH